VIDRRTFLAGTGAQTRTYPDGMVQTEYQVIA